MQTQIIPVIHYANDKQAIRNAELAFEAGCAGVFLIHMDGDNHLLLPIAKAIRNRCHGLLVGINFLGMDAAMAVAINIAAGLDMSWTDDQLTHSGNAPWPQAQQVREVMATSPNHLVFIGVAFKHQAEEPDPNLAARTAREYGFIPTTSGPATGVAAEVEKIQKLRIHLGENTPLAIASGITPANVHQFAPYLSHILTATGVSSSFYEFDDNLLRKLHTTVSATN